jgi:hypothetical protein
MDDDSGLSCGDLMPIGTRDLLFVPMSSSCLTPEKVLGSLFGLTVVGSDCKLHRHN